MLRGGNATAAIPILCCAAGADRSRSVSRGDGLNRQVSGAPAGAGRFIAGAPVFTDQIGVFRAYVARSGLQRGERGIIIRL
ncbi:hypothetical protein [Candidatus Sodalis sp. SoCistrobi]|uniref:hypothetical protein n=1 Tax=Candidatus Sodalis sp. SoCistrobi TaxID=1922216 RepID=UPI00093AA00B|nr:hypothetical protein [Candidatus Sodalis sp. SoCistrobi]